MQLLQDVSKKCNLYLATKTLRLSQCRVEEQMQGDAIQYKDKKVSTFVDVSSYRWQSDDTKHKTQIFCDVSNSEWKHPFIMNFHYIAVVEDGPHLKFLNIVFNGSTKVFLFSTVSMISCKSVQTE